MFHTWHKSFKFAVFCCGGEVVVPSDPPEKQRIKKTAKHWTIIMMQWVEPEQTEWISATCSSVKIVDFCFFSCFAVAGYFLISFPFMVVIRVCFPSGTNLPLKGTCSTWRYFSICIFIITLSFIHVCMDAHVLLESWPFLQE